MAVNFFHALTSPNQYIYKKRGKKFSFTQMTFAKIQPVTAASSTQKKHPDATMADTRKEQQLRALLSRSYQDSKSNLDKKEIQFLQSINSLPPQLDASPRLEPAFPSQHLQHTPSGKLPSLPPLPQAILRPIPDSIQVPKPIQTAQPQQSTITQNTELIADISPSVTAPVPSQPAPLQDIAHARNIPQNMIKNAGFSHIPDSPNIIVGIVKDARGNMLPNILVEIKDKEGSPVRAFKTNPLGQFASATPLINGSYAIELEDPKKQHAFDAIQITADGQIMMPIEIISHDAREELRKALFTN